MNQDTAVKVYSGRKKRKFGLITSYSKRELSRALGLLRQHSYFNTRKTVHSTIAVEYFMLSGLFFYCVIIIVFNRAFSAVEWDGLVILNGEGTYLETDGRRLFQGTMTGFAYQYWGRIKSKNTLQTVRIPRPVLPERKLRPIPLYRNVCFISNFG